jgi:C4-dicarboxylate-specific signal transduction histidine kinase
VWINLIKNASESLHSNKRNDKKLHIVSDQKLNSIHVCICDNGGGIEKTNIDKIFQPNFTTKKGGLSFGLGLGLSIVQRIINSYDGSIQVESKNSETIFTIILPIQ